MGFFSSIKKEIVPDAVLGLLQYIWVPKTITPTEFQLNYIFYYQYVKEQAVVLPSIDKTKMGWKIKKRCGGHDYR
jgi:hypothetical protein